jgi:hypothetical protein
LNTTPNIFDSLESKGEGESSKGTSSEAEVVKVKSKESKGEGSFVLSPNNKEVQVQILKDRLKQSLGSIIDVLIKLIILK